MAGCYRNTVFLSPLMLIVAVLASVNQQGMVWSMINVNFSEKHAEANLIQIHGGKTVLIDTGDRSTAETGLIAFLEERNIQTIDTVFISHPHKDHYGGVESLLNHHIQIGEIYFNIPDRHVCDQESPWGCDYTDVLAVHATLRQNGVPVRVAKTGDTFQLGKDAWMNILYAFDGVHTPIGRTDINGMSLVMMLHYKEYKFLFTGDLSQRIGSYIAKTSTKLRANVLKVPHHGIENTVPDAFFAKVAPDYALVPAPEGSWLSSRGKRMRNWFSIHGIPVWVNGMDGDVFVEATGREPLQIRAAKRTEQ